MPENKFFKLPGFVGKTLLTATVSLAGGVLWLSSCAPPSEDATANNLADNSLAGNASTPAAATPAPQQGAAYTVFVPNADAMLSRKIVRDQSTAVATTYEQKAKRSLELLFKELEFLPSETRLLEAPKKDAKGMVRLNFSKPFLQLDTSPETPVLLILDAISATLGALESKPASVGKPVKVLIVVEGKTVREFNQFSLVEPWQASQIEAAEPDKPEGNSVSGNKVPAMKPSDTEPGGGV